MRFRTHDDVLDQFPCDAAALRRRIDTDHSQVPMRTASITMVKLIEELHDAVEAIHGIHPNELRQLIKGICGSASASFP